MNASILRTSLLGGALIAPLAVPAQMLTNQQAGYFSSSFWESSLPTLNLNASGTNNGNVSLPASPIFNDGSSFVSPFTGQAGTIDLVWFSETAGWGGNDLYLDSAGDGLTSSDLVVENAAAPSNPAFGTSQLYDVSAGFGLVVDPALQSPDLVSLLDGSATDRFRWSMFNANDGVYDYTYYIFGIEDQAVNSDLDFSDLVFAVGFRNDSGFLPPGGEVPEPSTYGVIGVGLLGALIWWRRRSRT